MMEHLNDIVDRLAVATYETVDEFLDPNKWPHGAETFQDCIVSLLKDSKTGQHAKGGTPGLSECIRETGNAKGW